MVTPVFIYDRRSLEIGLVSLIMECEHFNENISVERTHRPVDPDKVAIEPLGKTLPASVHGPDNDDDVLMSTYVSVLKRK